MGLPVSHRVWALPSMAFLALALLIDADTVAGPARSFSMLLTAAAAAAFRAGSDRHCSAISNARGSRRRATLDRTHCFSCFRQAVFIDFSYIARMSASVASACRGIWST